MGKLWEVSIIVSKGSQAKASDIVRVGWFTQPGYQEVTKEGDYSGYCYEYLQRIAQYTGWKYEFIRADDFTVCRDNLAEGKIDLLGCVTKGKEYKNILAFPDIEIGRRTVSLYVKETSELSPYDFQSFDGITVAGMKSRNIEILKDYAKEHHFKVKMIYCNTNQEAENAVLSGKVDAGIQGGFQAIDGLRTISDFDPVPFYFATKANNEKILETLNLALSRIKVENPDFDQELASKYLESPQRTFLLTKPERNLVHQNKPIPVYCKGNQYPFEMIDADGEYTGIVADIMKNIEKVSGLDFVYMPMTNEKKDGIMASMGCDFIEADSKGYDLSNCYLTIPFLLVTEKGFDNTNNKVAIMSDFKTNDVLKNQNRFDFHQFTTAQECFDALKNGQVGRVIINSYSANVILNQEKYQDLVRTVLQGITYEMCIGVGKNMDKNMLSIINKALHGVTDTERNRIVVNNTMVKEDSSINLRTIVKQMPIDVILLFSSLFFALVLTVILLVYRTNSRRIMREKARELALFFSYVCKANDEVTEIDMDHRWRYLYSEKDGMKRIGGEPCYTLEELQELIHPDDYEEVRNYIDPDRIQELIDTVDTYHYECRVKGQDGKYHWWDYLMQGMEKDKMHPNSFMLYRKNIDSTKREEERQRTTLEKAYKDARLASVEKGKFTSRMSHEIRTPLNAVIGYMEIAKHYEHNPNRMKGYIEKAESSAKHLLKIINEILDMSSIESGKIKMAKEKFDFSGLVSNLTSLFYGQAIQNKIRFHVSVKNVKHEWLMGDPLRVNQVLINLLSNAIKFTPPEGQVNFRIVQCEEVNNLVSISFQVEDTGIGMEEGFLQHIFEPFEQQDASIAKEYGGTGLGMMITKNLVEMMGGTIEVSSKKGVGSTFTMGLEFEVVDEEKNKKERHFDFSTLQVLVYEPDPMQGEYLSLLLNHCGVESLVVESQEEVLHQIEKEERTGAGFDLFVGDWRYLTENESLLVYQIHKITKESPVRIVGLSYDSPEIQEHARTIGVYRILPKPIFQSTVFDMLVDIFGKYHTKPEVQKVTYDFRDKRVLLVEDNEINQEIAVELLEMQGIAVDCASDGAEAVSKMLDSSPGTYDVILMDIQMPVMDGLEATRRIRESSQEQAKTIPIFAMTANAFEEDIQAAFDAGIDDYFTKPIELGKLLEALNKYMNHTREV